MGKRLGYCSNDVPTVTELFNSADDDFFYSVKPTLHTSSSLTFLTRLIFRTVFALAPTT